MWTKSVIIRSTRTTSVLMNIGTSLPARSTYYITLCPLFCRLFGIPATSASVERVFLTLFKNLRWVRAYCKCSCMLVHVHSQWQRQWVARRGLCHGCKPLCSGCAPAGKLLSFHSVMQHQFSRFSTNISHHERPNCWHSWHQKAGFWKQIFLIFCGGDTPNPLCGWGYPSITHVQGHKHSIAGIQTIVPPYKLYCPQQEQTRGAATATTLDVSNFYKLAELSNPKYVCIFLFLYSVSQKYWLTPHLRDPQPEGERVWVKNIPLCGFLTFFPNGCEFFNQFLHAYYTFLSVLDYRFLFNYLQLWRRYAILSTTTQQIFTFH